VNDFTVHIRDLFSHLGNLLLPGANVSLELLDFVVKHKLELLKLLSLLFELVDSGHFITDGFLSLFDFFGLGLLSLKVFLMFLLDLLNVL
jgi:hypothetical protein